MDALTQIGAPKTRALLKSAIVLAYPNGYPVNPADHGETADSEDVLDSLRELDDEFYKYVEPLADLMNKFLASAA